MPKLVHGFIDKLVEVQLDYKVVSFTNHSTAQTSNVHEKTIIEADKAPSWVLQVSQAIIVFFVDLVVHVCPIKAVTFVEAEVLLSKHVYVLLVKEVILLD